MTTEKIKDKIQKLMALADSTHSEAESFAAIQKAQALMAEYKLSESDIGDKKKVECIRLKTSLSYGTRSTDHYLVNLAHLIAENFCCVMYVTTPKKRHTHYICFMGLAEDVAIAEEVLHAANTYIVKGIDKVWRKVCKEYDMNYIPAKDFNPIKIGYVSGYLAGLEDALNSQKQDNQEWGLVMVAPKEAQDYLASLNKVNYQSKKVVADPSYYSDGYEDGSQFTTHKKIG